MAWSREQGVSQRSSASVLFHVAAGLNRHHVCGHASRTKATEHHAVPPSKKTSEVADTRVGILQAAGRYVTLPSSWAICSSRLRAPTSKPSSASVLTAMCAASASQLTWSYAAISSSVTPVQACGGAAAAKAPWCVLPFRPPICAAWAGDLCRGRRRLEARLGPRALAGLGGRATPRLRFRLPRHPSAPTRHPPHEPSASHIRRSATRRCRARARTLVSQAAPTPRRRSRCLRHRLSPQSPQRGRKGYTACGRRNLH